MPPVLASLEIAIGPNGEIAEVNRISVDPVSGWGQQASETGYAGMGYTDPRGEVEWMQGKSTEELLQMDPAVRAAAAGVPVTQTQTLSPEVMALLGPGVNPFASLKQEAPLAPSTFGINADAGAGWGSTGPLPGPSTASQDQLVRATVEPAFPESPAWAVIIAETGSVVEPLYQENPTWHEVAAIVKGDPRLELIPYGGQWGRGI